MDPPLRVSERLPRPTCARRRVSTRRPAIRSAGGTRPSTTSRRSRPRWSGCSTSATAAGAASICATAFPRLFDLIDESPTGELDSVPKTEYAKVDEACTLCDMCFMTKCPYVPPHPFDIDIPAPDPALPRRPAAAPAKRARARAAWADRSQRQAGRAGRASGQLGDAQSNKPVRKVMEAIAGIDADALLPTYHSRTASRPAQGATRAVSRGAGLRPAQGGDLCDLLRRLQCAPDRRGGGPGACAAGRRGATGLSRVLRHAPDGGRRTSSTSPPAPSGWRRPSRRCIDQGYDIVALTACCGLMIKFEWPLLPPATTPSDAVRGDAGHLRIRRRPLARPSASPRASRRSRAASPCTTPATRGPRTWAPSRRRCCG